MKHDAISPMGVLCEQSLSTAWKKWRVIMR